MIVCDYCTIGARDKPQRLVCELCRDGNKALSKIPDLVLIKRKVDDGVIDGDGDGSSTLQLKKRV